MARPARKSSAAARTLVIEPGRAERHYWRDVWAYRELFTILAWRDVSVRYRQTIIGIIWALLRPLLTTVIFTVVFSRVAKLPAPNSAPYPVMVFAGMLPWFLFSSTLTEASNSLVMNSELIRRVYFPRIIVPSAAAVVALVDFAINLVLLAAMMLWFGVLPSWHILLLPAFILLAVMASLGPALLLTALNVKYRDVRFIIPFIVQFGVYVSPVGFSSTVVPEHWRFLYSLNPVVGVIDGFRWCILGQESPIYLPGLIASLVLVGLFLWLGLHYFRRTEKTFADVI